MMLPSTATPRATGGFKMSRTIKLSSICVLALLAIGIPHPALAQWATIAFDGFEGVQSGDTPINTLYFRKSAQGVTFSAYGGFASRGVYAWTYDSPWYNFMVFPVSETTGLAMYN